MAVNRILDDQNRRTGLAEASLCLSLWPALVLWRSQVLARPCQPEKKPADGGHGVQPQGSSTAGVGAIPRERCKQEKQPRSEPVMTDRDLGPTGLEKGPAASLVSAHDLCHFGSSSVLFSCSVTSNSFDSMFHSMTGFPILQHLIGCSNSVH